MLYYQVENMDDVKRKTMRISSSWQKEIKEFS